MSSVSTQLAACSPQTFYSNSAAVHVEAGSAIELTTGGHLTNNGHISTGPSTRFEESYSGISVNGADVTVVNHGAVMGGSNGIKAKDAVVLTNTGAITGQKGAGLKSKGNAEVVNYGVITGADTQRARQNDGDGDGLDIDKFGRIHNYGIIEGTGANGSDKHGAPNTSEGIAIGGADIYNHGLISGAHHGVLVDNGNAGPAFGSTLLVNNGSIRGRNGYGVNLVGNFNDRVINNGLISGGNGVALNMGGGDDVLTVRGQARFRGEVDGGSGTNQVILDDIEGGMFNGARQVQHLDVTAGAWTLTGALEANQRGRVQSGATLINQSRIGGTVTVEQGATYAGGTVNELEVAGTLVLDPALKNQGRIKRDLNMTQGSTLALKVGQSETHSTLKVGNRASLGGATLSIQIEHESDELLNRQLRIVDAAQIEGRFERITSNLETLTPELIYTATGAFVSFKRKKPADEA